MWQETTNPIIRIERQGEKFEGYTKAKSMRSWLSGQVSKYSKGKDLQTELILRGVLNAYNHFHPMEDKKQRIIEITLDNWKGQDKIDIYAGFTNDFIITEHIKDKETGQVEESRKEISRVNVNRLLFIIKKWKIGELHSCYEVADMLGYDWMDVWGNRVKIYFPIYYYPIKVLEKIGIIKYSGRGSITRIK